jgi:tRNA A37 threonylcarbamoyladenosine dehydratase/nitroreductase
MIESLPASAESTYLPDFFYAEQINAAGFLLEEQFPGAAVLDLFPSQKKELFKISHPARTFSAAELDKMYDDWTLDHDPAFEGVWVYYPWLQKLIHILSKQEFIQLRTNRNFYKISPDEQSLLSSKTVGIIGLSVGHAVALTMATERVCGKMKLADFDKLELSNLNRIKTGLQNLGINKAVITAREIAEIDPFIDITCFTEGITEENIDAFLLGDGKLDILIDECDSIDMKIFCRQKAKAYHIPVVMETSDRGMLDVERFDIEEDRPVMHGLLEGMRLDQLKNLTTEQKVPLVLKIVDAKKGSLRGKISMIEVGQSISTWPQLASAVTLGGAVVTDVCRRILLEQYHDSGRYYIDLEELAGDRRPSNSLTAPVIPNPYQPFNSGKAFASLKEKRTADHIPEESVIRQIVKAANHAPSTGNDQPWKWIYNRGVLYLFHDHQRSFSFGDFDNIASYISFGAAFENIRLQSHALGLGVCIDPYYEKNQDGLVAAIRFQTLSKSNETESEPFPELIAQVFTRCTNRNPSEPVAIESATHQILQLAVESINGAKLLWFTEKTDLFEIGTIIGECDRIRLLNPQGHADFTGREMRWTAEDAISTGDGIDIRTLGLSGPLQAALSIIRDPAIVAGLKQLGGGKALSDAAITTVMKSSAIGMIVFPKYGREGFFKGGMAMQRLWLKAEALGWAIHPLISPFYLFPRITRGNGIGLDEAEANKLKELRKRFLNIVPLSGVESEVFLFKIASAARPSVGTLRLPFEETFTVIND